MQQLEMLFYIKKKNTYRVTINHSTIYMFVKLISPRLNSYFKSTYF